MVDIGVLDIAGNLDELIGSKGGGAGLKGERVENVVVALA